MILLLLFLRIAFFAVLAFFATGALLHLLLFYERSNLDAQRGERRPLSLERLRFGLGAWARESGLHVVMAGFWISGVLPRGKLRSGAWLPREGEQRPGRPVLLVPGYAMNRGTLKLLAWRLEETGRPALAISLPYWKSVEELAHHVAEAVGELKRATGAEKVDVIAHSRGGVITRYFIQKMRGHEDVERFVTLGTGHKGTKVAAFGFGPSILAQFPGSSLLTDLASKPLDPGVEWHAINGGEDCMILPPGNDELPSPGRNVRVPRLGHTALLFSSASWMWVRAALRRSEAEGLENETAEQETADEAAARTLAQLAR